MNRLCQLSLAFILVFADLPLITHASDPDVLAELRDRWIFAAKEGDAVKLASLFAENGTLMPPGFPTFTGRKTIESFYRDNFAAGTIRSVEFHPKDRHVGANSVREHGAYQISVVPKNETEAPYTLSGRYLILGAKRPDGKWEILWEMHTIEPKVPFDQL